MGVVRSLLGGCWLGELWGWRHNPPISGGRGGHSFVEDEVVTDATVQVLRCVKCGILNRVESQLSFVDWLAERYAAAFSREQKLFEQWREENLPDHEYGYTWPRAVEVAGDEDGLRTFMYGQTMALTDDGQSVIYPDDLWRFVSGLPNTD